MTIQDILNSNDKTINKNLDVLAIEYKKNTGIEVCRSCPSDLANMVSKLKILYKMTNFEFKKLNGIYRLEKGKPETISNDKMTDELAIEFLKVRPERIELFSKYPRNYKELIGIETTPAPVKAKPAKKVPAKKPCTNCKKATTRKPRASAKKTTTKK